MPYSYDQQEMTAQSSDHCHPLQSAELKPQYLINDEAIYENNVIELSNNHDWWHDWLVQDQENIEKFKENISKIFSQAMIFIIWFPIDDLQDVLVVISIYKLSIENIDVVWVIFSLLAVN